MGFDAQSAVFRIGRRLAGKLAGLGRLRGASDPMLLRIFVQRRRTFPVP